jgi:[protein-PII] uridylyltransferase
LHYRIFNNQPVVRARPRKASACRSWFTRRTSPTCSPASSASSRAGYSIVDAKIHTTAHGYALDSFVVLDVENRENEREMVPTSSTNWSSACSTNCRRTSRRAAGYRGRSSIFRSSRRSASGPTKGTHFILSLVAADRPGLLYTVANTLAEHGANLQTAKITTLGERAEDVFLISGGDLRDAHHRIRLETELMERLKV